MITDNGLAHIMRMAGLEHYAKEGASGVGVTIQLGDPDGMTKTISLTEFGLEVQIENICKQYSSRFKKQGSMTKKCHNHRLQTNPQH